MLKIQLTLYCVAVTVVPAPTFPMSPSIHLGLHRPFSCVSHVKMKVH